MSESTSRVNWPPLAVGAVGFALLATLPFAAGRDVQGGVARLIGDAETKAQSALAAGGHDWARVTIGTDGIARLIGEPPNSDAQAAALQAAKAAVADRTGVPGVIARWQTEAPEAKPDAKPDAQIATATPTPAPKTAPAKTTVPPPATAAATPPPAKAPTTPTAPAAARSAVTEQDCARDFAAQLRDTPVRFASNATAPTRASQPAVAALAQIARACAAYRITVTGHSDTHGFAAANQRLSEQRARAILRALADAGVDPAGLRARGLGETRPLDRRRTAGADARNRRIEITVTPRA